MLQGAEATATVAAANRAVEITDVFVARLISRREDARKSVNLLPEEIQCIENGETIQAIKLVRSRTGMNLKESKALVDAGKAKLRLL